MMLSSGFTTKTTSTTEDDMPPSFDDSHRLSFFSRLFGRYPGSTTTVNSVRNINALEDDTSSASAGSKERVSDEEPMQVAVLISMPNPSSRKWEKDESPKGKAKGSSSTGEVSSEGEIPDVVFGVTSVGYRV